MRSGLAERQPNQQQHQGEHYREQHAELAQLSPDSRELLGVTVSVHEPTITS